MAKPVITVDISINDAAWRQFEQGDEIRDTLHDIRRAVEPRAVAKTGRRSGRLHENMGGDVFTDEDGLVLAFGTGVAPGTEEVPYDRHHWAPGKPGGPRASWPGTRPWTRTLRELGIEYTREENYDV